MNLLVVLIDSLNRHALAPYGPPGALPAIRTPAIDAFAERALRFDNHFVGSLPCMPARREIFAGRKEMLWRPWGPLEPWDARLPVEIARLGYRTAAVTDHYHYWEEAANGYLQGFGGTELVRGHELDNWRPLDVGADDAPQWVRNIERWRPGFGTRYYNNVRGFDREREEDFFPAKVFGGARRWLERHGAAGPFWLHVESFDVHEPFDAPEPYASMYGDPSLRERFTLWPPYQDPAVQAEFFAQASDEELAFIRSQYAAKLTMVDTWFGRLLETLEAQGLMDETMIVLTTDHGHDLGERGGFGKQYPHWDSHANIPLFVWHPELTRGGSTDALTTTVDLHATLLEAAGGAPEPVHGRSLLPLLRGEPLERDGLLYGTFGQGVCCTDGEWTLFKSPVEGNAPLHAYSSMVFDSLTEATLRPPEHAGRFIPGVDFPQWRTPVEAAPRSHRDYLFDRRADPEQARNVWDEAPEQRERMLALLRRLMREEGAPEEQFRRLGLHGTAAGAA